MRYAVIDANGLPTGALYDTNSVEIVAHHAAYGETLMPVADLVNAAGEDHPEWEVIPVDSTDLRAMMFLTDVQLLIGLVAEKWITEEEGAAWRDGTLPPQVVTLIGTLPEDQRFGASVRTLRARRIDRLDPLVVGLAASQGRSAGELDTFFQTYSQI